MIDTRPRLPSPPGTCDTHMHIFEPGYTMLPGANQPSIPAGVDDYRQLRTRLATSCAATQLNLGYLIGRFVLASAHSWDDAAEIEGLTAFFMTGARGV